MTYENSVSFSCKNKRCVLDQDDIQVLTRLHAKVHNSTNVVINSIYKKYSSLQLRGKAFASSGKRPSAHPYVVMASWNESLLGSPPTVLPNEFLHPKSHERPVNVHYYATVSCSYLSTDHEECHKDWDLACVSWFSPHPNRYDIGQPAEIWCANLMESYGMHSFVPLKLLLSRCARGKQVINNESVLVVVPLV